MTETAIVPAESGLSTLDTLIRSGIADVNGLDLAALGRELSPDEYMQIGLWLSRQRDWVAFAIGDWLTYGDEVYGEEFAQYAEILGRSPATLMDWRRVAAYVPRKRRRLDRLSYSHHREVASLPAEEQTEMLDLAEREKLSSSQLRELIRERRGTAAAPDRNGEDPADSGGAPVVVEMVVEAAQTVAQQAQPYGDGSYLVPPEPMRRLLVALGREA